MKNQKTVLSKKSKVLRIIRKNEPLATASSCQNTRTTLWPCLSIH